MDEETRRAGDRISFMAEVEIDYEGTKMTLNALDLSSTGVGLWGPARCPAGQFDISIPLEDALGPFETKAHVARQYHSDGGAVWGVAFDGLTEAQRGRLLAYVSRQAA